LLEGMLDAVPEAFFTALEEGGRLVAPLRSGGVGIANVFVKTEGKVTARQEFDLTLPPLYAEAAQDVFVFCVASRRVCCPLGTRGSFSRCGPGHDAQAGCALHRPHLKF